MANWFSSWFSAQSTDSTEVTSKGTINNHVMVGSEEYGGFVAFFLFILVLFKVVKLLITMYRKYKQRRSLLGKCANPA